jgi:hypothetical protein
VGADEVGGRPIDLCGAEGGQSGAGGVYEVVGLEDGLRGGDGLRALGPERCDERYREEGDGQPNASTRLQPNAAV